MYKTDQFDRKIGINGYLFDKLEATAETWQPMSVRKTCEFTQRTDVG
mgnify:CR=1 FL=1